MGRDGYSRKGFFGETIHYDSNGRKLGESRPNFWGGVDHYDANGNKTGRSQRGFWGEVNHYDNSGHKTGYSQKGFWGQTNHYDTCGRKTGESTPNFWGGSNYSGTGPFVGSGISADIDPEDGQTFVDDYDAIEAEMLDECLDAEEAVEWLEDNGYDPEDFDLDDIF